MTELIDIRRAKLEKTFTQHLTLISWVHEIFNDDLLLEEYVDVIERLYFIHPENKNMSVDQHVHLEKAQADLKNALQEYHKLLQLHRAETRWPKIEEGDSK